MVAAIEGWVVRVRVVRHIEKNIQPSVAQKFYKVKGEVSRYFIFVA
jgi:hypothetical protein